MKKEKPIDAPSDDNRVIIRRWTRRQDKVTKNEPTLSPELS